MSSVIRSGTECPLGKGVTSGSLSGLTPQFRGARLAAGLTGVTSCVVAVLATDHTCLGPGAESCTLSVFYIQAIELHEQFTASLLSFLINTILSNL